jgi:hypothetical protein
VRGGKEHHHTALRLLGTAWKTHGEGDDLTVFRDAHGGFSPQPNCWVYHEKNIGIFVAPFFLSWQMDVNGRYGGVICHASSNLGDDITIHTHFSNPQLHPQVSVNMERLQDFVP